jgi:hypothetical protein
LRVLDLDTFYPEQKILKLGGRDFDITTIPFGVTLQMYEVLPIMQKIEKSEPITPDDADKLTGIIHKIISSSAPDVTREWVEKNITIARFNQVMPFLFDAVFDDGKKKAVSEEAAPELFTSEKSSPSSAENMDGEPTT